LGSEKMHSKFFISNIFVLAESGGGKTRFVNELMKYLKKGDFYIEMNVETLH
jgi:hypothetical protein